MSFGDAIQCTAHGGTGPEKHRAAGLPHSARQGRLPPAPHDPSALAVASAPPRPGGGRLQMGLPRALLFQVTHLLILVCCRPFPSPLVSRDLAFLCAVSLLYLKAEQGHGLFLGRGQSMAAGGLTLIATLSWPGSPRQGMQAVMGKTPRHPPGEQWGEQW